MNTAAAPEMIRLTDLAALKGVGKAAMSERVAKLVRAGLIVPVREGRTKLINLAAFEQATAATTSLAKMAGAATRKAREPETITLADPVSILDVPVLPPRARIDTVVTAVPTGEDDLPPVPGGTYTTAQADHAVYKAALAKLDLDQRLGKVLPVADVAEAMARCAEALVRGIDQMPGMADDIAAAVAKNGAAGARVALKAKALELRELLAREMRLLGAPADGDAL